ncbi:hypothetical protein FRC20_002255 [Serendipita sp. 405]|nr:hypothetical protein FRC20_002255 [Serendipita sp. 405]
MPHKRAKHSKREEERRSRGADLVPNAANMSLSNEPVPKSMARVLNAAALRESFHKKRKWEEPSNPPADAKTGENKRKRRKVEDKKAEDMKILPSESLIAFNQRIENSMRSEIRSAVQQGNAHSRRQYMMEKADRDKRREENVHKKQEDSVKPDVNSSGSKIAERATTSELLRPTQKQRQTEFETITSQGPKRLNDIVTAPPDLSALTKGRGLKGEAGIGAGLFGKKDIILPEQRRMMEIEREKAVKRYRELKEKREQNKATSRTKRLTA